MGCFLDHYRVCIVDLYSPGAAADAVQQNTDSGMAAPLAGICTGSRNGSPDWSGALYVWQPTGAAHKKCCAMGGPAYLRRGDLDPKPSRYRSCWNCSDDDSAILDGIEDFMCTGNSFRLTVNNVL